MCYALNMFLQFTNVHRWCLTLGIITCKLFIPQITYFFIVQNCNYFFAQRQVYSGYSSGYSHKDESHQDLSKVPGTPGVDYPIYHAVPETSFNCKDVPYVPGMYANVETGCQVRMVLLISTKKKKLLWFLKQNII